MRTRNVSVVLVAGVAALGGAGVAGAAGSSPARVVLKTPKKQLRTGTKSIKVAVQVEVCDVIGPADDYLRSIKVVRSAKSIVLKATQYDQSGSYQLPCAGVAKSVVRRVSLRGKLGHRAIKDGFFSPPRTLARAPR